MSEFTIDDLKKRDEGALAAFHRYLAPKVRELVARLLYKRHALEVDDVANEVFLRLFSRLDELTKLDDTLKIERYCLRATHNFALEYLARLEKEDAIVESYESQLEIQTPPKFDKQIEEKESQEIVQNYLSRLLVRLPSLERQILKMHVIDGMSAQEISDSLGMDIYETRYALNCVKAKVRYRYKYMQKI